MKVKLICLEDGLYVNIVSDYNKKKDVYECPECKRSIQSYMFEAHMREHNIKVLKKNRLRSSD